MLGEGKQVDKRIQCGQALNQLFRYGCKTMVIIPTKSPHLKDKAGCNKRPLRTKVIGIREKHCLTK